MKKSKYYELLKEYQSIIAQKEYNENFYNKDRLLKIQKSLNDEFQRALTRIRRDMLNQALMDRRAGCYFASSTTLLDKKAKIEKLLAKVMAEEHIADSDFEDTFYQLKLFRGLIPALWIAFCGLSCAFIVNVLPHLEYLIL